MAGKASIWTYNVVCGVILTFLGSFGAGLYQQTVLPSFLLYIGGNNKAVGFATGLVGIAQMVIAFPVAWHADTYRRSTSIRFGGVLTFLQTACLAYALRLAEPGNAASYSLICVALVFQGICNGILGGPLMALMDDSVPAGSRSEVNTVNMVARQIANAGGPLLAAGFFANHGNTWSLDSMKTVIITGLVFGQLSIVFAMTLDDSRALKEESEAVHLQVDIQKQLLDKKEDVETDSGNAKKRTFFGLIGPAQIPYVMFLATLTTSMGAGMTIKFFPIFFQQECHMSPGVVNMVYASIGVLLALSGVLAQRFSKRIGRMQVVIPCKTLGVIGTLLLGLSKPVYTVTWVMIPLYMARYVLMNAPQAVMSSITADYTQKSQRARFMALQSVAGASWCGSAFVGGWLIDHYGFGVCFYVTAVLQGAAIPIYFLIAPHVAKETDLTDALEARKAAEEQASGLQTPLMTPVTERRMAQDRKPSVS